jgi:thiamine transporter ThiT
MIAQNKDENNEKKGYSELRSQIRSLDYKKDTIELDFQEQENHIRSVWLEKKSFRIALMSMFTALSVVLAYTLASFPNIELFTLSIFLGGFIMGKKEGLFIGLLSALIFVFFNPWGVSPLPLMVYQITHYALVGLAGALTHDFLKNKSYFKPEKDLYTLSIMSLLGFSGAIITVSYDLLTSFIDTLYIYGTLDAFPIYFLTGIVFTTIHEIGNTLGFIFILPGLIQLVYKILH